MMNNYPEILAFGEPLFEFSQTSKERNGEPDFLSGFGGDASNFAIAAARQGAKVGMLTSLGNDEFGKAFLRLWEEQNVSSQFVTSNPQAKTGVYFINHSEAGHEFSFLRTGSAAAQITPASLPVDAIENAKLLHVTAITQAISSSSCDAVFEAIEVAKSANTLVSYDTNLRLKLWGLQRARAIITETTKLVDICLPSLDEAQLLTGLQHADDIIDHHLKLGAKVVVLKCGSEGATIATENMRQSIKPMPSSPIDATAAGDSFAGSFCTNYVAGKALQECLRLANATASITIEGLGAVAPLPTLEQVMHKLETYAR